MSLDPHMVSAMRKELEKRSAGQVETYLPWYTAAAGGLGGAELGGHLAKNLDKKYKFPLQLAGTLLGTGLGVHGGEAIGSVIDKRMAKQGEVEEKPPHPAWTAAKSAIGTGLGVGAGYLGAKGVGKLMGETPESVRGKVPWAPMAIGGAIGLAAPLLHQLTVDKMRRDHLKRQEMKNELEGT